MITCEPCKYYDEFDLEKEGQDEFPIPSQKSDETVEDFQKKLVAWEKRKAFIETLINNEIEKRGLVIEYFDKNNIQKVEGHSVTKPFVDGASRRGEIPRFYMPKKSLWYSPEAFLKAFYHELNHYDDYKVVNEQFKALNDAVVKANDEERYTDADNLKEEREAYWEANGPPMLLDPRYYETEIKIEENAQDKMKAAGIDYDEENSINYVNIQRLLLEKNRERLELEKRIAALYDYANELDRDTTKTEEQKQDIRKQKEKEFEDLNTQLINTAKDIDDLMKKSGKDHPEKITPPGNGEGTGNTEGDDGTEGNSGNGKNEEENQSDHKNCGCPSDCTCGCQDQEWSVTVVYPGHPRPDQAWAHAHRASSPLVLDLDGDGVTTTSLEAGVYFDHNGDGVIDAGDDLYHLLRVWVDVNDQDTFYEDHFADNR